MALRAGIMRRFLFSTTQAQVSTIAAANPPPTPSTTLFVSGLNKRTTSEKLHETFSKFGELEHAKVITDRSSGYSKGFGFVRYTNLECAEQGIKGMNGQFLDGWVILAEYARQRTIPGQSESPATN